jgi:phospholipid/cholesterol/gamma-HCH transport system substrate-binding protein
MRMRPMKPIRERNPVPIAIVGLVILVALSLLAYRADAMPVIGGGTTFTADFSEAAGLDPGNEVRVAGVKVGKVTGVVLDGGHVKVTFRVTDTWIGNASTAAIMIKTLLGEKYLAVDPLGTGPQDPDQRIPLSRTTSPYDVTTAFNELANTFGQIDTEQLGESLRAIADTFRNTPPNVRKALDGLSALSKVISSRDAELAQLLAGTKRLTGTLSGQNDRFTLLLRDGNRLLAELIRRRNAIGALLTGTRELAAELSGLVDDLQPQMQPMLRALDQVTAVLQRNRQNLDRALALSGPYWRLVNNAVGNGRWFDGYLCGLVPKNYLEPGTGLETGCQPPEVGGGR